MTQSGTRRLLQEALEEMITALEEGKKPAVTAEDLPCFKSENLINYPEIDETALDTILAGLNEGDIPTLKRALDSLSEDTPSWLGFKIVTDPTVATDSEDTDVVGIMGEGEGSADDLPGIFFANEDKEIVFSRPYSERDMFQMLDITRGPHMHNEQYAGVAWLSIPLDPTGKAYIFGAGEVSLWVARMALDVGFASVVIDDDATYLDEERFPASERILLEDFGSIPEMSIAEPDYVLVLTRGHMYDPEALIYGLKTGAHYVGMMGSAGKNERVFAMAKAKGISAEQIEAVQAPIGLKFGAKTPPELAMCIVAQMIQDRAQRRKDQ